MTLSGTICHPERPRTIWVLIDWGDTPSSFDKLRVIQRRNPPAPLYKGEKFAPALRRSTHGERIKVKGGVDLSAAIKIVIAGDVVFVEDFAELGFDEDQQFLAGVGQAVLRAFGDYRGLAGFQRKGLIAALHFRFT